MNKKIYIIGIGGIGVSAVARYYNEKGYKVFGSDLVDSELIDKLKLEGIDIIIGEDDTKINKNIELVIYTEAVADSQKELIKAKELGIKTLTYPEALGEIANDKKLITVAGTHGKSTTTSLVSLILKNSKENFTSIVGTLLKEFDNKNFYHRSEDENNEYFVIEACEYKRSFLNYKPTVGVILNIELDHLDYYKDGNDYMLAYKEYLDNIKPGGFAVLNGEDLNCKKLVGLRKDINYIEVYFHSFTFNGESFDLPNIHLKVPGNHTLYDAKVAYVVGHMLGIHDLYLITSLEKYEGVWRRMEEVGFTENKNLVVSDYGHHPTEIFLTLPAIKHNNPGKKIITIFQPHQFNRTIELLDGFKDCFSGTDTLIVPNIYESRDSEEDKKNMNTDILLKNIKHPDKHNGNGLENTVKLINKYDKETLEELVFVLLGAGDVDNLRYDLVK